MSPPPNRLNPAPSKPAAAFFLDKLPDSPHERILGLCHAQAQTVRDVISFQQNSQSCEPGPAPAQGLDGKLYGAFPSPEGLSGTDLSLTTSGKLQITHAFSTNPGGIAPFAGLALR
jgi:hypothetical protein